jgi:hypothetical protein
MAFRNLKEIVDAEESGASRLFTFRKSPSQASTAGVWFDLSMSPGNPVPNYYAASPLVSVAMRQSTDGGFFHGSNVSPADKYLARTKFMTSSATGLPMPILVCDYLVYYPFIDEGTTDEQLLTNSVTLPRSINGKGVMIMAVSVAPRTSGQQFIVNYTNSDGVSGRVTRPVFQNSAAANGSIITSSVNNTISAVPFLPLQAGDTGVRSIESVTMLGADVGLFTLVLVKPLLQTMLLEQTAAVECLTALDKGLILPKIEDDAYLNLICQPNGSLAGVTLIGDFKYIWK